MYACVFSLFVVPTTCSADTHTREVFLVSVCVHVQKTVFVRVCCACLSSVLTYACVFLSLSL